MYCNLFDSHTHSDNSHDGHSSISMLCEAACTKGISGLCITDHCECDIPVLNYIPRFQGLQFDMMKARAAFSHQITLLFGVELGQPHYDPELAETLLSTFKFDFVLASLHNNPGEEDICTMDFTEVPMEQIYDLLQNYYENLLNLAKWNQFDALAHLTYPLRYIQGMQGIPVDMSRYDALIHEILKTVADNGKAIEINTSTMRQGLGMTMPSLEYVKLFKELGGKYVTIGSDAHYAKDVGADLQVALEMLKEAGFEEYTVYRRREPTMLKIL